MGLKHLDVNEKEAQPPLTFRSSEKYNSIRLKYLKQKNT